MIGVDKLKKLQQEIDSGTASKADLQWLARYAISLEDRFDQLRENFDAHLEEREKARNESGPL